MKYGESLFDIAYLIFAIGTGIFLLTGGKEKLSRLTGSAALVLGCGDAFHLVPRVLNYFVDADFSAALGIGKLVTSVTMTVFYLLMYYIWLRDYQVSERKALTASVWALSAVRIVLCLFPQNEWLTNGAPLLWGILRNVPFAALGIVIVCLYRHKRREKEAFRRIWLYVALSFLFYLPVVVGAEAVPLLGMLMLPKTVCYTLILFAFLKHAKAENNN